MKIIFFIALLYFPALTSGQSADEVEKSTYRDAKYPFSISYSGEWIRDEKAVDGITRFVINHSSPKSFATLNITVVYDKELVILSPTDFVESMFEDPDELRKSVEKDDSGEKYISSKKVRLGGYDGFVVKSTITDKSVRSTMYTVSTLVKGCLYILTYGADEPDFDKFAADFEAIVSSFRIEKEISTDK